MTNRNSVFGRSNVGALVLGAIGFAAPAQAQDVAAAYALPNDFVGMASGTLQPSNTFNAYIGSSQTAPAVSEGQTGRQVYYGGLRYRAGGDWQVGASIAIFDDEPADAINGSDDTLTFVGAGLELKYQLVHTGPFNASVLAGVETIYFSRGAGLTTQSTVAPEDKDRFWAATLSLPMTYQVSDRFWMTGELGYTYVADEAAGQPGFGSRGFVSAGAVYQLSDRVFAYGSLKMLARDLDGGIDAPDATGPDYIYTFGGRFSLTPQTALNAYVTNAFSQTPAGSNLLFFPEKVEPVFGLMLSYIPSGQGVGEMATTFRPAVRTQDTGSRYADGFTINSPHTLAADRVHVALSYGDAEHSAVTVIYAADPDIQFEFTLEDYTLGAGSDFRTEAVEDARLSIGGRWQAMDEAYGQPFNLAFGLSAGRDLDDPSLGVLYVDANASRSYDWGNVGLNARAALYRDEIQSGLGASLQFDIVESLTAIGEYTVVFEDEDVWALGVRHTPSNAPFSIDIYATNAAGKNGIGTLLSNDTPQIGVAIHWEGGLDLL